MYNLHYNPYLFPRFLTFPIFFFLMTSSSFSSSLPCHQKFWNEKKTLGMSLCKYINGLYSKKKYDWINQNENCEFKVYFDWGLIKPI